MNIITNYNEEALRHVMAQEKREIAKEDRYIKEMRKEKFKSLSEQNNDILDKELKKEIEKDSSFKASPLEPYSMYKRQKVKLKKKRYE